MDLHIALYEIERSDGHVSETTAENTKGGIGGVEGPRVHLDLARLAWHWNDEVPGRRRDVVVGAAASSMVLSRLKDLCEVETV